MNTQPRIFIHIMLSTPMVLHFSLSRPDLEEEQ